jgi:IS30 family transposase
LKRSASTINREVRRNGGVKEYRAATSDAAAWNRSHRPKSCKLAGNDYLGRAKSTKLIRKWSPQQIAGWLMREHPNNEGKRVSHETIYRSLYILTRGVLKKELLAHLRATRSIRRSCQATLKRTGIDKFNDAISIRERPAEVEDRAVPGHWEGDLIAGSGSSFIAILIERHTRFVMLAKVGNKDSHSVIQALIEQSRKLPKELCRSRTWDRGFEKAGHKTFTLATDIDVFLCEPHSPWQRGTNENTNRLLRQYFPKGTNLAIHSQAKLSAVARQFNERPRKTLGYETPTERFNACVGSIG